MKVNITLLLLCCYLAIDKAYTQTIEIYYHLGFDCSMEINGLEIRGGCWTNERMIYNSSQSGRNLKSNKLAIERVMMANDSSRFGNNLEKDSLKVIRLIKIITLKEFKGLVNYLNLVESEFDKRKDMNELIQQKVTSNWDENTFDLNRRKIRRIKKLAYPDKKGIKTDSLIQIITEYINDENLGVKISSVTEFLTISFKHNDRKYTLSQSNLGGPNVTWDIEIDDKIYFVISPELNKMINQFLSNKMRAKKRITQFSSIEVLENAFNKN